MDLVDIDCRISETVRLKRENRLLWGLLIISFLISAWAYRELKSVRAQITPQAVYDACNRSN